MTETFFFTGFPGFLGTELISNLLPSALKSGKEIRAVCLVQKKFRELADQSREALYLRHPEIREKIDFVEGDITQSGLGMAPDSTSKNAITQIFHLAAVYDLSVQAEVAHRINVVGTEHVLRFAQQCPNLKRFHHISTCYVSGKFNGLFTEKDLDVAQTFNNHYEETKFLSEVAVQQKMKEGMPVTIYRPAVVVGNSQTGATQKFDGPYFVMQWLLRQKSVAVMPMIGNPQAHYLNVVPSDFVISALSYLSQQADTAGKVFHLADPHPLTIQEMVDELGKVTERKLIQVKLPLALAKFSLDHVPGVASLMRIPSSTLNYFVHPTQYETAFTLHHLSKSGIKVPPFRSYSQVLVNFMKAHPNLRTHALQ